MKRRLLLILLVPILVLAITSCDADMRSNFAGFLGGLGGNVYIDSGMVEPNTADVKAAAQTIAGLGSGANATSLGAGVIDDDLFGIEIDLSTSGLGDIPFMKPQSKDDQTKLKDDLASALDSPTQTEELKKEMAKPISDPDGKRKEAVKGTVEVLNAAIDQIIKDAEDAEGSGIDGEIKEVLNKLKLSVDDEDDLTEGDVLMVQMMANLISNTVGTLNEIADGGKLGENLEDNKNKIFSIVDDALFTAQIAEELSGAAGIDFSGQLGLADLLENMNKGMRSSRQSRDGEPDKPFEDAAEFLETINALGPELVNLFGLKKIGVEYNWPAGGYRRFVNTQQAYRGALEHAVALANKANIDTKTSLKGRGLTFDGSTAIKYLISVIITDANEWSAEHKVDGENVARLLLRKFVTANPWIATGSATVDTEMRDPDIGEGNTFNFEAFGENLYDKGKPYIEGIFENAIVINDVGGLKPLSTAIREFLDDEDEFDGFFKELGGK